MMTRKEFLNYRGWSKEEAREHIGGFWNFDSWWENQDKPISNFEIFCTYPFYKLNKIYNKHYKSSKGEIGSTYDWLEMTADNETIAYF